MINLYRGNMKSVEQKVERERDYLAEMNQAIRTQNVDKLNSLIEDEDKDVGKFIETSLGKKLLSYVDQNDITIVSFLTQFATYTDIEKALQRSKEASNQALIETLEKALDDKNITPKEAPELLCHAIRTGQTDKALEILELIEDVNILTKYGSFLQLAAQKADVQLINKLLEKKANVNLVDPNGEGALHYAIKSGNSQTVKLLLETGIDVNLVPTKVITQGAESTTSQELTALQRAVSNGSLELVQILLEHKADVNLTAKNSKPALHFAAEQGNAELARILLEHKADVDLKSSFHSNNTALAIAVSGNKPEIVAVLREYNVNLGSNFFFGNQPKFLEFLIASSYQDKHELRKALLALPKDGDPNHQYEGGKTLLYFAACFGDRESAQALLSAKADINIKNTIGYTPLHGAARMGNYDVAQLLIEHGAYVDAKDDSGLTPMHCCAITQKHQAEGNRTLLDNVGRVAQLLIEHGANVDAKDNSSSTPLHLRLNCNAANSDAVNENDIIKLLINGKADVAVQNELGNSILHLAASHGHSSIILQLMQAKADVDATNKNGQTPLEVAKNQAVAQSFQDSLNQFLEGIKAQEQKTHSDNDGVTSSGKVNNGGAELSDVQALGSHGIEGENLF